MVRGGGEVQETLQSLIRQEYIKLLTHIYHVLSARKTRATFQFLLNI